MSYTKTQLTETSRGMHMGTHPDFDIEDTRIYLDHADEIVMHDGTRVLDWDDLTANIGASGAGGLDTGAAAASTWYEIHAIRKSSDGTKNLLLHRAHDYSSVAVFTTATDAERGLRLLTGTPTDKLAQGVKFSSSAQLHFIQVRLRAVGTMGAGVVWFTLETDSAGSPSGTVLATSDKMQAAALPTNVNAFPTVIVFRTPATPSATPTQYHLVLQGDYAKSDANYIAWRGVAAGGYADGVAKEFNGATWSAASGVGDFNFDSFAKLNSTSVTMPAGYDQRALIGYAFRNSSNVFWKFTQVGRHAQWFTTTNGADFLVGSTSTSGYPTMLDVTAFLPPVPCLVDVQSSSAVANTSVSIAGVPRGFLAQSNFRHRNGGAIYIESPVADINSARGWGQVFTEYQRLYLQPANANNSGAWVSGWEF